ncbi:MAG: hypothetical protein ACFB51_04650 [Anaerolineae bacterium]
MLDQERRKITLIDELLAAKGDEQQSLVDENIDLIDESFLELLRIVGERAGQTGDSRTSLRALNLRSKLIESTEAGQRVKVREEAYQQAELELNSIVTEEGHINREDFVDLIVDSADNPDKIQYLSSRIPQILDYTTFNILTNRIDATSDPDQRAQLQEARETMLKVAAEYEQASRAVVERAADTLRMLLSAPDVVEAIHQNLDRIDETFMQVLQVNLQEARQSGSVEVSARLKQIRDEVLRLVEQQAPPEIQLINQLLSEQDDNAALDLLASRADAVTPQLIEVMDQLIDQLNAVGNVEAAQRLAMLRNEANRML